MSANNKSNLFIIFLVFSFIFSLKAYAEPQVGPIKSCFRENLSTKRLLSRFEAATDRVTDFSGTRSECIEAWNDYIDACQEYWDQYLIYEIKCNNPGGSHLDQVMFRTNLENDTQAQVDSCGNEADYAMLVDC